MLEISLPSMESTAPPNLMSSTNLLSIHSSPESKPFMKKLRRTGPKMEPCGTPLVTDHQPHVTPFTISLSSTHHPIVQPLHHVFTICTYRELKLVRMCISSSVKAAVHLQSPTLAVAVHLRGILYTLMLLFK